MPGTRISAGLGSSLNIMASYFLSTNDTPTVRVQRHLHHTIVYAHAILRPSSSICVSMLSILRPAPRVDVLRVGVSVAEIDFSRAWARSTRHTHEMRKCRLVPVTLHV
jgi:hypothetical protein